MTPPRKFARLLSAASLLTAAASCTASGADRESAAPALSRPATPSATIGTEPVADPNVDPLAPVYVQGQRYKDPFPEPPAGFQREKTGRPRFNFYFNLDYALSPYVVTAARAPQTPEHVAQTARVVLADALRAAPTLTLDGTLRSVPGFSLFRRSDSFSANPTAQGVSLRGLGPSGASRSLLLLDGVPLNDPFGGWVAWTKIPRDGLARAEVIPGGGATAWGNASLGGVVQLFTRAPKGERIVVRLPPEPGSPAYAEGKLAWGTRPRLFARADLGDYGTRSLELTAIYPAAHGTAQLLSRIFSTDGFPLVAPERRGPIDIAAWSRHRWLTARWRQPLGSNVELLATVRGFEEKRGNGTPYQQNSSREKFASLGFAGQAGNDFSWNGVAYAQDQSFASTFSAVNATRTAETPASDQFDVPATSFGAAWSGTWRGDPSIGSARTNVGVDARLVRGETREHFTFANGAFTRLRVAGGEQLVAGIYGLHERRLAENLRGSLGARLDTWRDTDGHRRESDRATGALLRNDRYADQDDVEFSPSAGLVWAPGKAWRLRASGQQAFRRPTLNELHRPFRVGPNVTEANAALKTERVTSAEVGVVWSSAGVPPASGPRQAGTPALRQSMLTLGATAFANDLRDAVGNVTIARGPGTFPIVGFVAAGGVGRQRLNLDRTRVRGLELSAKWTPAKTITITGDYLYNNATVTRTAIAPTLVGKRLAQVPRESAAVAATWQAPGKFTLTPRVRWIGRQFEDDENQLILGEVVVADLAVSRPLGSHLELFVSAENLGNVRIETGRTADGLVNIGTPRLAMFGVRGSW